MRKIDRHLSQPGHYCSQKNVAMYWWGSTKPAANMNRYTGSCHCGAVAFTFSGPDITQAMRCDCSICARKGMSMSTTTVAPENIEISAEEGVLSTYQFGSMTARHHFCSKCGIHAFVETRLNPGHYRINLGCVDDIDALRLPEILYDGKALE